MDVGVWATYMCDRPELAAQIAAAEAQRVAAAQVRDVVSGSR
jgi:hypothetical protein